MDVAVILNGNVRTLDACRGNIIQTLSGFNPDYFVSTYDNLYGYYPCVQDTLRYYDDPILLSNEIEEKFKDFNSKGIIVDKINDMTAMYTKEEPLIKQQMRHKSSFLQYNKLLKGLKLIQNSNKKYDVVIKTRCDIWLNNNIVINKETIGNEIIVSTGNVFPNDCIIIGTLKNMISICEFICNEFYECKYNLSILNQPHGMLQASIQHYNLNITQQDIMSHVVRVNKNQYY